MVIRFGTNSAMSLIVTAGDTWDVEGNKRYSPAGARVAVLGDPRMTEKAPAEPVLGLTVLEISGINCALLGLAHLGQVWSVSHVNEASAMSKVCQVTGKRPVTGNNVSHSHRKTRRRFLPNLHYHRFWVESEQRFVRLRVSAAGMRVIDKKGIDTVLTELRARGEKI